MRADRLLSALLLLQAHGRLTGRELARRLEVSERTMHRDMEALSASGVPVFAMRGSQGGWQLDEGWRTQVPGLDEAELRALLMAQPQVVGDERLVRAAERALTKLMSSLPVPLAARRSMAGGWRSAPRREACSVRRVSRNSASRSPSVTGSTNRPPCHQAMRMAFALDPCLTATASRT